MNQQVFSEGKIALNFVNINKISMHSETHTIIISRGHFYNLFIFSSLPNSTPFKFAVAPPVALKSLAAFMPNPT